MMAEFFLKMLDLPFKNFYLVSYFTHSISYMAYQNISASLSAQDMADIKQALQLINQKMPFLVQLTKAEEDALYKMGPKSIDFVNDCKLVAENYKEILPANFNQDEFMKDAALAAQLNEINMLVNTLAEKVQDTSRAVGAEAMKVSLLVYDYAKTAEKTNPGLKSVVEQLKQRFKMQGRRTKKGDSEPK
jgi:hypothetical protein